MTDEGFQTDEGLEALGGYSPGRGIDAPMKAVFDLLYEVDESIKIESILDETFDRVNPAIRYHARRAVLRWANGGRKDVSEREAWDRYVKKLIYMSVKSGTLVVTDSGYIPNALKPPRVQVADGSVVRYSRAEWSGLSNAEKTQSDIQAIQMEIDHALAGCNREMLKRIVTAATRDRASSDDNFPARIRWILSRPSTEASKGWLICELAKRCYPAEEN